MSLRTPMLRWRTVILAAARLAGVYTLLAIPFLLPWAFAGHGLPALSDLAIYALPMGALFLGAFAVLAIARRAGFIVLWLLLTALWVQFLRLIGHPSEILLAFITWSGLAIPLALLGALGVSSALRLPFGRWQPRVTRITPALWAALLIPAVGLLFQPAFGLHPLREAAINRLAGALGWFIWAPAPAVLAALAVAHVWIGTTPAKVESPAA